MTTETASAARSGVSGASGASHSPGAARAFEVVDWPGSAREGGHPQLGVVADLEEAAGALTDATRTLPCPFDSHHILVEFERALDHLAQASRQLAAWHLLAVEGRHFAGETEGRSGSAAAAGEELEEAAWALQAAAGAVGRALAENGHVRWYPEPR